MCHPVFLPDFLQLPSLPMFLPHPGAPYLPPTKQPPTQHKLTQPVATLPTLIHLETKWTSGSSTSPKPPSPVNNYPYYKKVQTMSSLPNNPPSTDAYIKATELAAFKLPNQEVEEFRSDVNKLLKQQQHKKHCNLNPAQCRALTQLKQDNTRVVLTADKEVAMVIMDQQDYNNKAQALLQDTNTYKVLPKDPTPNSKTNSSPYSKVSKKQEASVPKNTNNYILPVQSPKFYGLLKLHKTGTPIRPIVSSRGSITYGVAKELSHIIKPLVGQSPHHLKNTQHFIQQLQGKKIGSRANHHLI